MFKALVFAVLAWLAVAPVAFADGAEAHYQNLLANAKAGGRVDWQALRFAYADRPHYVPDSYREHRREMFDAANNGSPQLLALNARRVLDDNYADGMGHFFLAGAEKKLGQEEESQREWKISDAIFESIKTGDGLSYEHAFTVISIGEEYDLFVVMRIEPGQQSLQQHDGHTYDVFETKDKAGQPVTYYFNIDRIWATTSGYSA